VNLSADRATDAGSNFDACERDRQQSNPKKSKLMPTLFCYTVSVYLNLNSKKVKLATLLA
jgi:hypothetical protein